MSNARNLADVISGNYDVPAGSLDNVDLSSRVAKSGDTMTGVLTIQNAGFDSRITLQNTGTGGQTFNVFSTMDSFTQGGGNLLFHTSSAPNGILKMDSAGRVTMPYQPMATFYTPSQVTATEGSVISWTNSAHEQGGLTANTSTNRMTVPVAGKYLVSVTLSVSSTANNVLTDGIFINIEKNGTAYLGTSAQTMHNFSNLSAVEVPFSNTMIVNCAANDYITFSFTSISSSATIQYGSANIHLIG